MKLTSLAACAVLAWPLVCGAQATPANPSAESRASAPANVPAARSKPTAAEKRCLASRRRVERQHEVIAETDARTARERKARESCKTKRVCENLDRALRASETRAQRHAKQLAQFEGEAQKACVSVPNAATAPIHRSSTAVTKSPTTTNPNSTR
jgi:hypothetical protein